MTKPLETNLLSEIEFWRSLIDEQNFTQQSTASIRIKEALALAEFKLKQLKIANNQLPLH